MKKFAIASLIALAASTTSAYEVGLTAGRDFKSGSNENATGVTIGQHWGAWNATLGVESLGFTENNQTRWTAVGGYDVAKVGSVTLTAKAGAAYLNNQHGDNGYAMLVGVGASYPLTKTINLSADIRRQIGQDRVSAYDGNTIQFGVKYAF